MIDVYCPFDDSLYHADEAHIGKFIRCQKCGAKLKIERSGYTPLTRSTQQSIEINPEATVTKQTPITPHPEDVKKGGMSRGAEMLIGAGIAAIGVMLVILLLWINRSSAPSPQQPSQVIPPAAQTPAPSSTRVPVEGNTSPHPKVARARSIPTGKPLPLVRLIPPCAQGQPIKRPFTGEEIEPNEPTEGKSTLLVRNGTGYDAAVRLVDSLTGRVANSVYVQAGDSHRLSGIEPGSYRLTFETGLDWVPACMDFLKDASYSEFEEALVFRFSTAEDEETISTYVTRGEVTLNPVVGGNARIRKIDRRRFYQGDQNFTLAP